MFSYHEQEVDHCLYNELPLSFPKGTSKSEFVVFANKIQFLSNKVRNKVYLCENF